MEHFIIPVDLCQVFPAAKEKKKKKPKFRRRQDQYSGNSGHVEQSLVTEGLLKQHDGISWVYVTVLWLAAVKCCD